MTGENLVRVILIHRLVDKSAFLQGRPKNRAPIAAHRAGAQFRLFLELRHGLRVMPTSAVQVIVMLITIFVQAPPHVARRLVATKSSIAHSTSSGLRALPART